MLTFLLALLVGLGSLALYLSGFIYPEVYRKNDLIWSGVGLFYALVLLVCGDRITGGVLLGQIASVSLIGWFAWQTLDARLGHTPNPEELKAKVGEALQPANRTQILGQMKQQFSGVVNQVKTAVGSKLEATAPSETASTESYTPLTRDDFGNPSPTVETTADQPGTVPDQTGTKADSGGATPTLGGAIAGIGQTIGNLFKKPEKNTSTYVRKEFRDEEKAPTVSVDSETGETTGGYAEAAVAAEKAVEEPTAPVNQPATSDSDIPADEIVQEEMEYESTKSADQPVHPNPPDPELVEAAIEDAEKKHLPADPPETTEETDSPPAS
ncbi:Ycf66 family protein [Myxacorys almedinensis]|uniref:Ycf66 family protein n=1 Tax=Myxacorys almedinensis A TaxID=2690445 RepID=A0A8J7Z2I9_9CYAN|nr:Ycf66 family protein [Myxacorys almedinensis]NDJ16958.1 hypothetical protein [Myxacorys almedinensis A]